MNTTTQRRGISRGTRHATSSHVAVIYTGVEQSGCARLAHNQEIAGSNPAPGTGMVASPRVRRLVGVLFRFHCELKGDTPNVCGGRSHGRPSPFTLQERRDRIAAWARMQLTWLGGLQDAGCRPLPK